MYNDSSPRIITTCPNGTFVLGQNRASPGKEFFGNICGQVYATVAVWFAKVVVPIRSMKAVPTPAWNIGTFKEHNIRDVGQIVVIFPRPALHFDITEFAPNCKFALRSRRPGKSGRNLSFQINFVPFASNKLLVC